MTYAEIETMQKQAKILFEPSGWALSYQKLHDQTDVSGWEMFLLESHDNFNNPFAQAMQSLYTNKGWFGLILRDVIRDGGTGTDDKGRLHLTYVSHAGTEWEQAHDIKAPKNGFYVPNDDCETINGVVVPFQPGTIVPFETVKSKKEAVKRFEKHGLDPEYVSRAHRLDSYKDDPRFAGRDFGPGLDVDGRFDAGFVGRPSCSGFGWIASLPAYREQELVMRVRAIKEKR
ncbi:MAG: hypothetical protein HYU56_01490 [Candidatus Aenigmarchaeota archaeon]|nr:hypothetical protein [Candidatus Aenigmarchaeota archaeon]